MDDLTTSPATGVEVFNEVGHLRFALLTLEALVGTSDTELTVDEIAGLHLELADLNRTLSDVRRLVENRLGETMDTYSLAVEKIGAFKRHRRKSRKAWDKEALLGSVLDSRLVNETTGELIEETPLDKVLTVWNLGTPRTTALDARGLQADEFCEVNEESGWQIEVVDSETYWKYRDGGTP